MVAAYVGRRHAVAVNSGHLGDPVRPAGRWASAPGDEVIVPDFTFPATANAVVACGATPVLADIDLATFNVEPRRGRACPV